MLTHRPSRRFYLRLGALLCIALYGVGVFRAFIPGACSNVSIYLPPAQAADAACETPHSCCSGGADDAPAPTEAPGGLPQPFKKACAFCQLTHSPALALAVAFFEPPATLAAPAPLGPICAPARCPITGQPAGRAPPVFG